MNLFRFSILYIIFFELLSIFAWANSVLNLVVTSLIILGTFVLSLKKLRYGIFVAIVELIIGSHGYLFSLDLNDGGLLVSVRIGIFAAVMLAWITHILRQGLKKYWQELKSFPLFKHYVALAVVIIWGLVWGVIRNEFSNVFFDFNNWVFFVYLLPLISVYKDKNLWLEIRSVAMAALSWLIFKTILLLYIFSHQFIWALPEAYQWIRDTRVGEITMFANNFYRIFIQSQIYALLAFFILLPLVIGLKPKTCKFWFFTLNLAAVIISFSRSFWVGGAFGLLVFVIYTIASLKLQIKKYFKPLLTIVLSSIISVGLIFMIINLPPRISGESLGSLLSERTTVIEAAGSSRINMLKPLRDAIIRHPMIGSGFGTTVTYRSVDPRVLITTAGGSGEYTTYAFEWAYLDMLLKFGLAGTFVYLFLILKILQRLWFREKRQVGFFLALLSLLAVNFFTPYLNHPLGIGFILITSILAIEKD